MNTSVLKLAKKNGFPSVNTEKIFEKFKGGSSNKDKFYNSLANSAFNDNIYKHTLNIYKPLQLLLNEILDWINTKNSNLHNYSNNSSISSFLEVDYPDNYPDELHHFHNNYP